MATIPEHCWQIAAGDQDRNYTDVCIRHSAIMMGPGSYGSWESPQTRPVLEARGVTSKRIKNLELFCRSIKPGHMIVLRLGMSEVHAVGIVRGQYEHNDFFADVDGWDLNNYYRVEWIWAKPEGRPEIFNNALNFGDTTQRLCRSEKTKKLFEWIDQLPDPTNGPLSELPLPGQKIEPADISRRLFDYGVGSGSLSSLENRIKDLCSLARWYQTFRVNPSEAETVAHLVVPLLISLGWTPQTIALEFHQKKSGRADVVLYANGNRKDYSPIVVIEAKRYEASCLTAGSQVRSYAEGLPYARRIVVTDGIRYGIFVAEAREKIFRTDPSAYLNLAYPRNSYPVYGNCGGGDEAMLYMSAFWSHRFNHPAIRLASEKLPEGV